MLPEYSQGYLIETTATASGLRSFSRVFLSLLLFGTILLVVDSYRQPAENDSTPRGISLCHYQVHLPLEAVEASKALRTSRTGVKDFRHNSELLRFFIVDEERLSRLKFRPPEVGSTSRDLEEALQETSSHPPRRKIARSRKKLGDSVKISDIFTHIGQIRKTSAPRNSRDSWDLLRRVFTQREHRRSVL
ncbi:uncharacterized protein LOC105703840 [Orussus abietinus]|uniref:uncharacterized protein LOC105703840 n=1 Tax=Orussus abietinus TaxID=222816 RepID=UPI000625824C|nr:uncharacterized protein LOC105703840 [Orussus abietinus]